MLSIVIIVAGFWGYFQTKIFPIEQYGHLHILTAFLGGAIIGMVGGYISTQIDE
jgi:hypothetical protein